jgi:hypothetical protein
MFEEFVDPNPQLKIFEGDLLLPQPLKNLKAVAKREKVGLDIIAGNILDPDARPDANRYHLAIASEVISHFRHGEEIELLLAKITDALQTGGIFLFNTFVAGVPYQASQMALEIAQTKRSDFLWRSPRRVEIAQLPLDLLDDKSVVKYQRTHLPHGDWPATPWFERQTTGRNRFPLSEEDDPPIQWRWLTCGQRSS